MQHNKWAAHAAILILLFAASAFGAGQVSVMDPVTKLPKYLKGGDGIDINGATGTIRATGVPAGGVSNTEFKNYTTIDRPARFEVATAAQGAKADKARSGATYTILPYGDSRLADYYCSATDCGVIFQTVLDLIKSSGKGGNVRCLEGTYPFTTTVIANDADSVTVEGNAPMGMWGSGGTVFSLNANVEMFSFGRTSTTSRAVTFKGIHFKGNSRNYAMIHSVNGHNYEISHNYFEQCMPCLVAERPWDWWVNYNNFRSCGSGNTVTTAAVVLANATVASDEGGIGDNGSGFHAEFNRFETRPGTSFYVQPSSSYTMNIASFIGNKFEGVAGQAFPAIYGSLADSRVSLNTCYYSDSNCFNLDSDSYSNSIDSNYCSATAGSDLVVSGDDNIVAENSFNYPVAGAIAHITVDSAADGTVVSNNHKPSADTVPLLSDSGSNTDLDSLVSLSDWPANGLTPIELGYVHGVTSGIQAQLNDKVSTSALPGNASSSTAGLVTVSGTTTKAASVTGTLTQGKQATFDLNGNLVASTFDTGAVGTGSISWGSIGGTLSNQTDLSSAIGDKQATLVNQTNIKSINGSSLLGSGDLTVPGMTYPGAGVPISTGAAWGSSLAYGFGANNLLQLNSDGNIFLKATDGTNTQFDLQARNGSGSIVSDWITAATVTPQYTIYDAINGHNVFLLTPGAPDNSFFMSSAGAIGLGTNNPAGQLDVSKQGASAQITATVLSGGSPTFLGRESGWTAGAPAPTPSGSTLLFVGGQGWDDTPGWAAAASVAMVGKSSQAYTTTARGGYLAFQTTADNTTSRTERARVHPSGCFSVGNTVDCGTGNISATNYIISGYEEKVASYTVSKDSSKITLASGTAVATLTKTLPAGDVFVTVTVAGAAASGVSLAAESGGSISWGDAGAPTFTNNKTADVVCHSQNAAATTTAAWRCVKGGDF